MSVLDRNTTLGRSIAELVSSPIYDGGISPLVVDVGARNGMFVLPSAYTRLATLVGFEPNPQEFEKLVKGKTDAHLLKMSSNDDIPKFKSERFFDFAIWDSDCVKTLYITKGAGACTLMGPTLPVLKNTYYRYPSDDPRRGQSFYDLNTKVMDVEEIPCKPLDGLFDADESIDFLKVDVEGGELNVFHGARELFRQGRILFVQAEFQVFPYYEDHSVFGHQHVFMFENGMRLIDLSLDSRYCRGSIDLPDSCTKSPVFAGDALFIIDPDRNDLAPMDRQRLALILLAYGFNSLAINLIEEAGFLNQGQIEAIRAAIASRPDKSRQRQLLDIWNNIPVTIYKTVSKISRRIRKSR